MSFSATAAIVVVVAAVASALVRRGHRWVLLGGIGAALVAALTGWAVDGSGDFEGPPWAAAALFTIAYGGAWAFGVAIGVIGHHLSTRRRRRGSDGH